MLLVVHCFPFSFSQLQAQLFRPLIIQWRGLHVEIMLSQHTYIELTMTFKYYALCHLVNQLTPRVIYAVCAIMKAQIDLYIQISPNDWMNEWLINWIVTSGGYSHFSLGKWMDIYAAGMCTHLSLKTLLRSIARRHDIRGRRLRMLKFKIVSVSSLKITSSSTSSHNT